MWSYLFFRNDMRRSEPVRHISPAYRISPTRTIISDILDVEILYNASEIYVLRFETSQTIVVISYTSKSKPRPNTSEIQTLELGKMISLYDRTRYYIHKRWPSCQGKSLSI